MAMSGSLGVEHEVELARGRVRYRDTGGAGPVVVFVHGLLVNADLWRRVVPAVASAGARCLAPDWPLGSHEIPMPDADLTPLGVAALIGEFLERLDLREVTLVANDTGGGLTQLLMARRPERVAGVVLTPSDSLDYFFPPLFAYLPWLARIPGGLWLMLRPAIWTLAGRLPFGFGALAKHRLDPAVLASWAGPGRRDPAVRADTRRFLRAVDRRDTLAAAEELHRFDRPVLLVWSWEDRVFPISLAHRLAERLPRARVVGIGDSRTFVPEDQPDRLVDEIVEFLREHRALPAAPSGPAVPERAAPSAQPG
jgi:pimeloyl-ACP methyl ester carboxylesterase